MDRWTAFWLSSYRVYVGTFCEYQNFRSGLYLRPEVIKLLNDRNAFLFLRSCELLKNVA